MVFANSLNVCLDGTQHKTTSIEYFLVHVNKNNEEIVRKNAADLQAPLCWKGIFLTNQDGRVH